MAAKLSQIQLPDVNLHRRPLHLVGTAPLCVHAFAEKARKQMLNKQMKLPAGGRDARDPFAEVESAQYRLPDGRHGFPSVAFKAAAVTACTSLADITKTAARQAFRIEGFAMNTPGLIEGSFQRTALVPLVTNEPTIREDVVRLSGIGRTAEMRYRPEYSPWGVELWVVLNPQVVSFDQLTTMFMAAGHGVGVGEYRPERDGDLGTFEVVDPSAFEAWKVENGL